MIPWRVTALALANLAGAAMVGYAYRCLHRPALRRG